MSIVPDKITPEIGWRSWVVNNGILHSTNYECAWPLREPLEAECSHDPPKRYVPRRYGRVRPIGCTEERVAQAMGGSAVVRKIFLFETGELGPIEQEPPAVQLPEGWGYELEEGENEIPGDDCSCGIYALKSKENAIRSPYFASAHAAIGAVNLWGKIIPGTDGYRAQFAYPLFLYTDERLHDYGVPVRPLSDLGINMPTKKTTTVISSIPPGLTPRGRRKKFP